MTRLFLLMVAMLLVQGCVCDGGGGGTGGGGGGSIGGRVTGTLSVFQGAQAAQASSTRGPTLAGVLASRPQNFTPAQLPLAKLLQLRPPPPKAAPVTEWIAGEVIVRLDEKRTASEALGMLRAAGLKLTHKGFASEYLHLLRAVHLDGSALSIPQTHELAARLQKVAGVRFTEVNQWQHAFAVPNDKLYPAQWHYPALNLPAAWDVTQGSASVVIAVIDTGIVPHPDLDPKVIPGIDMITDTDNSADGDGRDDNPLDMGGDLPNGGSSWHGTHTAGTCGAATNNSTGVAGVDWNAKLLPVRVLGTKGGGLFDIAAGMTWATGGVVPGSRANQTPSKVISMSLGGTSDASSTYQDVIDAANGSGAVFVIAAGNSNENASRTIPCIQQSVICVGATRFSGSRASYSNFGAAVTVMAPGGETAEDANGDGYPDGVLSALRDASNQPVFQFSQGTSMATPHVAGIVGLMKAVNPALTFALARQHLTGTANTASTCTEGCGSGMVNAHAAVLAAKGQPAAGPAKLSANTTALFFSRAAPSMTLGLANLGGQSLSVTALPGGAASAALKFPNGTSTTLAGGQQGGIPVAADFSGLADGVHSAQLLLNSNGGEVTVNVQIRVGGGSGKPAEVALVYEDSNGQWVVGASAVATAESGYAYSIDAVAGTYFVVAVIDENANGNFDESDPFGIYPTSDSPEALQVTDGVVLSGANFPVAPNKAVRDDSAAAIGGACTSTCPDNGQCVTAWPGGYCSRDCTTTPCPIGSICLDTETTSLCLASCTGPGAGQSTCRVSYVCYDDGVNRGVCLPRCTLNSDCGTNGTCNTATGYCQ